MDAIQQDYSPAEVAAKLGASESWIRRQARAGKVSHQRYGRGRIAFTGAQIEELRALATVKPAAPAKTTTMPALAVARLGATARSQAAHRARRTRSGST